VKICIGTLFLVFAALHVASAIGAAPPQQVESKYTGLPWAYGFATTVSTTGAPAPPPAAAEPAEDADTLRHLPESTAAFSLKQIDDNFGPADWFPGDHPLMPNIVAHGRKPGARACGFCHYPNGKGRPNNAGIAGLPYAYIVQQLEDFRIGARTSWDKRKTNTNLMIAIAQGLTDDDMKAAAAYFSSMKWTPWIKTIETDTVPKTRYVGGGGGLCLPEEGTEPIDQRILEVPANVEYTDLRDPRSGFIDYVPVGSIQKGEFLVNNGGAGKTVGCASCHGEKLRGNGYIPAIAGRSSSYLARQLYDFQHFTRNGPGAQLMQPIVKNLSEQDILDITAYVASLSP
jgi:cytochrome c553